MSEDYWDELRHAHETGNYKEDPPGRLVFPDGTIWFQEGIENFEGGAAGISVFGFATVACLFVTAIGLHDGLSWWPWTLGAAALCAALMARFVAKHERHLAKLKKALELGVFFCPDEVVFCRRPKQHFRRASVAGFRFRFHGNRKGSGTRFIHLELTGGEEISSDIHESAEVVALLREWHEQPPADAAPTETAAR